MGWGFLVPPVRRTPKKGPSINSNSPLIPVQGVLKPEALDEVQDVCATDPEDRLEVARSYGDREPRH